MSLGYFDYRKWLVDCLVNLVKWAKIVISELIYQKCGMDFPHSILSLFPACLLTRLLAKKKWTKFSISVMYKYDIIMIIGHGNIL